MVSFQLGITVLKKSEHSTGHNDGGHLKPQGMQDLTSQEVSQHQRPTTANQSDLH